MIRDTNPFLAGGPRPKKIIYAENSDGFPRTYKTLKGAAKHAGEDGKIFLVKCMYVDITEQAKLDHPELFS